MVNLFSLRQELRLFVECSYPTEEPNKRFALHFWSRDGRSFFYWETSIKILSLGMTTNHGKTCDVWWIVQLIYQLTEECYKNPATSARKMPVILPQLLEN